MAYQKKRTFRSENELEAKIKEMQKELEWVKKMNAVKPIYQDLMEILITNDDATLRAFINEASKELPKKHQRQLSEVHDWIVPDEKTNNDKTAQQTAHITPEDTDMTQGFFSGN